MNAFKTGDRVLVDGKPAIFEREVGSGECIARIVKDGRRVVVPLNSCVPTSEAAMPAEGMVTKSEGTEEAGAGNSGGGDGSTEKQPRHRRNS